MTGEETLVFAAAIAAASIGLGAALILCVLALVGSWRLFRNANQASELVLRLADKASGEVGDNSSQLAELKEQAQTLIEQQQGLQETARNILETAAIEGGTGMPAAELELAITRLDGTVGQMAATLANLIQLLERQQESR